jgi:F-type H+-transporting ATPase subunit epsilon
MASAETFSCSVITPEHKLLEVDATFVAFPAHDGEVGILLNRAPLVCKLGSGLLRISSPSGDRRLFVDGGFAQVVDNRVAILTEAASAVSDIDSAAATGALAEARAMKISDEDSYRARERAIASAKARLKLSGR